MPRPMYNLGGAAGKPHRSGAYGAAGHVGPADGRAARRCATRYDAGGYDAGGAREVPAQKWIVCLP